LYEIRGLHRDEYLECRFLGYHTVQSIGNMFKNLPVIFNEQGVLKKHDLLTH
jgi:hypothetical protein